MTDRYGYIAIETLLKFCENSKDHAVTPNDFMRMARVQVPEPKSIEYQDCANALLKLWMDNVLTDGEYYKIICKLNAHQLEMPYEEGEQERSDRQLESDQVDGNPTGG